MRPRNPRPLEGEKPREPQTSHDLLRDEDLLPAQCSADSTIFLKILTVLVRVVNNDNRALMLRMQSLYEFRANVLNVFFPRSHETIEDPIEL